MYISVIRHGIAQDRDVFRDSGGVNDEERPLTPKGVERMIRNSRGIKMISPDIELIVTSPLARAFQTTEILKSQFPGVDVEVWQELKPEYEAQDVIKKLQQYSNKNHIALVGHEPNLSQFINFCLTITGERISHMKKGGLCLLQFNSTPQKGSARLLCLIQPSRLRFIAKHQTPVKREKS